MTTKDIEYIDFFENEMIELTNKLKDIEALDTEMKQHLDTIKNKQVHGTLNFIGIQTSNLLACKKIQLDIIKEKATIKKQLADLYLKRDNMNKDELADNTNTIVNEVIKKITIDTGIEEASTIDVSNDESIDDIIDNQIKKLNEEKIKKQKNEVKEDNIESKQETDATVSHTDENKKIIVLRLPDNKFKLAWQTEFGKIIEDSNLPKISELKMKISKENKGYAEDMNGKLYAIINKKTE